MIELLFAVILVALASIAFIAGVCVTPHLADQRAQRALDEWMETMKPEEN